MAMEKYLEIAVSADFSQLDLAPYKGVALEAVTAPAGLAAIVVGASDLVARAQAKLLKQQAHLDIPVIYGDKQTPAATLAKEVLRQAQAYENEMVPAFLTDLINFADEKPTSFTTPGHHNGQFYDRHPAGMVFKRFFGDKMLTADVSDTVPELGDTLTHGGTPLTAEQKAAQVFHADKVYFCTNGTTSANTICASALLAEDDLVLFDRNNHKSLYNSALVMTGATPVYLRTDRNPLGLIGPLVAADLDEAKIRAQIAKVAPKKANAPRPFRLAVLQLETYDGVFYNARWLLEKLGSLCDYVLFDCAWGGYEQFVDLMADLSPLNYEYGPDAPGILVTQSIHKQQAGLAQTSQILKKDHHLRGQKRYVDHKHFNNAYLKYVTTSYSYPIYASLTVNAYLADGQANKAWWEETLRLGIEFRKQLLKRSKLFKPLVPELVAGQKWSEIPTEVLASDRKYWQLDPKESWHGFNQAALGEAILSPLKLTIQTPGVNLATGEYEASGIPGPVVGAYLTERRIIAGKSDLYSNLFLLTPGESRLNMQTLLEAYLQFEKFYLEDAPLEKVLPRLVEQTNGRYQGYGLRQLCQEMHEYYAKLKINRMQQALFLKPNLTGFVAKPQKADALFMKNEGRLFSLDNLKGKVALEGALPYPPGVFIVAPGERWQQLDIDYFKALVGAMEQFAGFDPEIQGVYITKQADNHLAVEGFALDDD